MKRKTVICIIVVLAALASHYSVYSLTKQHYENVAISRQENESQFRQSEVASIEQELNSETIASLDDQNAYDQIVSRGDKSFLYRDNGSVLIYNGEVIMCNWSDPLDSNKYYQKQIQCFQKYFADHQEEIDFGSLSQYGFTPEVAAYGFAVYPDTYENYHAYSNYYRVSRLDLELAIGKYKSEQVDISIVTTAYRKYVEAKQMLTEYIANVTPGDL